MGPATGAKLPAVIPVPQTVVRGDGGFRLTPATRIFVDRASRETGQWLAAQLRQSTGFPLEISTKSFFPGAPVTGAILLTTAKAGADLGAEGYELVVAPDSVVIRAPQQAGVFYGAQTLRQLLPPEIFAAKPVSAADWQIPCVTIRDQPRFAWRGLMLDVSRHFFTPTEVERVLDLMALYKLNRFHWHLVDDQGWRIEIKKYPRLTSIGAWRAGVGFGLDPKSTTAYDPQGNYGGYYTAGDIREVVAYAAARHITIVPEIELPGHSSAALTAYPQFGCANATFSVPDKGGVFTSLYCAGNDATFAFLGDVLSEVADLFPGRYLHIGGDEAKKTHWQNCSLCQRRISTEGLKNEHELQSYFVRRVEQIVNAHGKTLIGWSEIREGGLAPNAALMDWIGGGAESAASGHDVVMTPQRFCYFDHVQSANRADEPKAIGGAVVSLKQVYQFEPVPAALAPEFKAHVLGGQANLWTEYVPNLRHAEYMMFPRLGALAEVDWSPASARDWDDFQARARWNEKRLDALGVNYRPMAKPE